MTAINPAVRSLSPSRTAFSASLALATLASLALLGAAPAAAQAPPGEALVGFQPVGDYLLVVEGEAVPAAEVYSSETARAILVVSGKLPSPALLWPGTARVEAVSVMKMAKQPDGAVTLLPGAGLGGQGRFEIEGLDVVFEVGGVSARLKPKPDLVGLQSIAALASEKPDYEHRSRIYQPSDAIVERLKKQPRNVKVEVFFGTWCPACGQMVPRIMKVAQQLDGSNVRVEFYGLPRQISDDPRAKRYGVQSVPTGIVFVDGKEKGRITGNGWRSPERALSDLLGS